ncbi:MAG TPA: transglycosylase domain-containing protein [Xanthobacteraceae bacterium]|nr:transglycosylase domain-containing protein [Xanthobacteraceae bacterium]
MAKKAARTRREPKLEDDPDIELEPQRKANSNEQSERAPARRRPKKSGSKKRRSADKRSLVRRAVYWSIVGILWLGIAGVGTIVWVGAHLPPLQSLDVPKRPPTIQIVDIQGRPLATRGDLGGSSIPLNELPRHLPRAFMAIEDRRFYDHAGIDPIGLIRALVANVMHRGVSQGGSTITQQLAKNLFLTQERTVNRKLQEVALAFWLERKFTKDEILELYLNRIYFGAGAYGVEAASQRYFGKSARQITLAESAMLAGLVKSPSRLAPTNNFKAAERRAQVVLAAMNDAGLAKELDTKIAATSPPSIVSQVAGGSANYVADYIKDALNEIVGRIDSDVIVETTVDATLQATAEKALIEELAAKGEKLDAGQGALVAMTPNGAIRALVGGKNYAESQFNRAVTAKRQPGSAFKPFVYLTALERGLTPDTLREDKPISLKGWRPENYTREYFGAVPLSRALAMSLNTVSVRLTLEFGPTAVTRTAYRLGIASKLEPNASISLGTSEVTPLELVSAYVPFANGGVSITPHVIERVKTAEGKVLYRRKNESLGRIIEPAYVAMMNRMMRETVTVGTARKADLPGWSAAGKTGTSQDFRDAWFVGYTGHLVTGVWIGNDDASPMNKATGSGLPVDIWSRFMKAAHQGVPVAPPPLTTPSMPEFISRSTPPPPDVHSTAPVASIETRPRQVRGNELDTWSIDQLFRRR